MKKALSVNIIRARVRERKNVSRHPLHKKMQETERHAKRNTNPSHEKTKKR